MVNLGIGLPEGVAGVAAEEGLLEYITLSTEPGVFGGLPCSGHSFGPAVNATAIVEMNEMYVFFRAHCVQLYRLLNIRHKTEICGENSHFTQHTGLTFTTAVAWIFAV